MRKRIIGLFLCLAIMCMLLPSAFAADAFVVFDPTKGSFSDGSSGVKEVKISDDGQTVTAPGNPSRTGYDFKGWRKDAATLITENPISLDTYGLKNGDTLTAEWKLAEYAINAASVSSELKVSYLSLSSGGAVAALDPAHVPFGTKVLVQLEPNKGYDVASFAVTDASGVTVPSEKVSGFGAVTYSFTMPAYNVNLSASVSKTPDESISLSASSLAITINSSLTGTGILTATVQPSTAAVTWTSSDPAVAKVTPSADTKTCTVTGLKNGSAVITATSGTKSATCDVTVSSRYVSILNMPAKFTSTAAYTLYAYAVPDGETITWTSSDPSVLSVTASNAKGTEAVVRPLKSGSARIVASIGSDATRVESAQTVTVALSSETYKVVSNANGCWYYDVPTSYQIIVNAPYTKTIQTVSIYNSQLGTTYYPEIGTEVAKTYDVSKPSQTILTFTKAFMQTLPRYTYQTIKITFEDGTATTYLHILSSTGRPITGDVQFNPYWIALAVGAAGLGAALTLRKKEDKF